jgi:hypothetical protein
MSTGKVPIDLTIRAQESLLRAERELEKIKLHMRNAKPSDLELAVVRLACLDANRALEDVYHWATTEHRKEKE